MNQFRLTRFRLGVYLAGVLVVGLKSTSSFAAQLPKSESISPKAMHDFSALLPREAQAPKPSIADQENHDDTNGTTAPKGAIIRVVGKPFRAESEPGMAGSPSGFFSSGSNTNLGALEGETRAFGSQALPNGGGQFSPYLAPGQTDVRKPPPTFIPRSFDDWMHQDNAFGDLGGIRSKLHNIGIDIGGRWLGETSGNPTGGKSHEVRAADEEAFFADVNVKKLTGVNLGIIHFMTIIRQGESLANTLPALDSPMEIAGGGEHAHLGRLSWEMVWNKYVRTEMGDINTENDFGQSATYWGANLYCQFQNNGICGMPQSLAMNGGYSWYPTAVPGAWLKFYPAGNNHYLVSSGVYSVEPDVYKRRDSWHISTHNTTGAYIPVQLGWHRGGSSDYAGALQTNIKIGGFYDTTKTQNVYSKMAMFDQGSATSNPAGYAQDLMQNTQSARGRYGIWAQADQQLQRDKNDPRRGTAIFGTFEWSNAKTAVSPYFMTFGIVRKGTFRSRPDDTISLGGKVLWVNSRLTKFAHEEQRKGITGIYAPGSETMIELNYGYRPAPWLLVRPGVQYTWSPGGTNRYGNAFLMDMEGQIIF